MQDHLQTTLVVQVETVGGQYLSARLLSPWRSHVVGREWKDIEHKLQAKAVRELRSAIPRKWLMSDPLAALPIVSQALIKLEPPERLLAWQEPIEVTLETFRWEMPDGMCLVKVPAVHCDLYGPSADIDDVVVNEQIRVALVRLGDRYDLWDVRKRFFQRSFSYRLITVQSPLKGHGAAKQSKAESAKSLLAEQRRQTVTLRAVASDLSRAQLEPVFGRNSQAIDVAEYLMGQTPQSVLLVGPAGVGKTAIVHQLVHLMSQADTPLTAAPASKPPTTKAAKPADETTPAIALSNDLQLSAVISGLRGRKIWSTTGSRLVSGMSGMGMWQERCLKLIREAHATHGIVHVGSVTELMEAGKIEGQPGVASMVRQAVARGRLVIIGECTPEQIALIEREEPLLLRSMVRYDVTEPAPAEVTSILRQAAEYRTATAARKQSRRCTFTESALEELNGLHRRYASYSALPAQPLRLMQSILERSAAGSVIDAAEVARAFATQTGLPRFLVDDSVTIDLER
ncbi:MAG: hypothetical protein IT423_20260, partial [Pirellulaceae bacterium]|nr:hypothetical protein [Pirellulaceae bacterium]